jgi:hypothetical protein
MQVGQKVRVRVWGDVIKEGEILNIFDTSVGKQVKVGFGDYETFYEINELQRKIADAEKLNPLQRCEYFDLATDTFCKLPAEKKVWVWDNSEEGHWENFCLTHAHQVEDDLYSNL